MIYDTKDYSWGKFLQAGDLHKDFMFNKVNEDLLPLLSFWTGRNDIMEHKQNYKYKTSQRLFMKFKIYSQLSYFTIFCVVNGLPLNGDFIVRLVRDSGGSAEEQIKARMFVEYVLGQEIF